MFNIKNPKLTKELRVFKLFGSLTLSVDANFLAVFAETFEFDLAFNQSKESVVIAATDIVAGVNGRAALANQN